MKKIAVCLLLVVAMTRTYCQIPIDDSIAINELRVFYNSPKTADNYYKYIWSYLFQTRLRDSSGPANQLFSHYLGNPAAYKVLVKDDLRKIMSRRQITDLRIVDSLLFQQSVSKPYLIIDSSFKVNLKSKYVGMNIALKMLLNRSTLFAGYFNDSTADSAGIAALNSYLDKLETNDTTSLRKEWFHCLGQPTVVYLSLIDTEQRRSQTVPDTTKLSPHTTTWQWVYDYHADDVLDLLNDSTEAWHDRSYWMSPGTRAFMSFIPKGGVFAYNEAKIYQYFKNNQMLAYLYNDASPARSGKSDWNPLRYLTRISDPHDNKCAHVQVNSNQKACQIYVRGVKTNCTTNVKLAIPIQQDPEQIRICILKEGFVSCDSNIVLRNRDNIVIDARLKRKMSRSQPMSNRH